MERTAPMRILKGMLGAFCGISLAHLFGVLLTGPIEILTVYYFQNMVVNLIFAFFVGLTLSVSESKTWSGTAYATAGSATFIVTAAVISAFIYATVPDMSLTLGRLLFIGLYAIIAGAFAGAGFRMFAGTNAA